MVFGDILDPNTNYYYAHEEIAGLVKHFNESRRLNPHLYFVELALCNYRELQMRGLVIGDPLEEQDC